MHLLVPTPNETIELALEVLAARHPQADSAFVAGSFMRGEGSATSDIDLVVVHPALPQAYRESFLFKGIPVETFVHDPETLSWFLEQDRQDGRAVLVGMVAEGVLIGPRQDLGQDFKQRAMENGFATRSQTSWMILWPIARQHRSLRSARPYIRCWLNSLSAETINGTAAASGMRAC